MKNLFILLAAALLSVHGSPAQSQPSADQAALRNQIAEFLTAEGFVPSVEPDGEIVFKREGFRHRISVSPADHDPMSVTVMRDAPFVEGYDHSRALHASARLTRYPAVKVECTDRLAVIKSQMYLRRAEAFEEVFYKITQTMDKVYNDYLREYTAASACRAVAGPDDPNRLPPFFITDIQTGNVDAQGNAINDYGQPIQASDAFFLKPRITVVPLRPDGTYTLRIKLYTPKGLSVGPGSDEFTYENRVTVHGLQETTHTLSGWGEAEKGKWKAGDYRWEFWSDGYCLGSARFKVF